MDRSKLKQILKKIKVIIDAHISIMDENGYIIESTDEGRVGDYDLNFKDFNLQNLSHKNLNPQDELFQIDGYIYYSFISSEGKRNIFSINALREDAVTVAKIIGIFFNENFYEMSQSELLKNMLINNPEEIDINKFSQGLPISLSDNNLMRVLAIEVSKNIMKDLENLISHIYPNDLYCKINNTLFCIIEICCNTDDSYYSQIYDAIYSELFYEPKIGIGHTVNNLADLANSYRKAVESINLGKLFFNDNNVYCYRDFGLPRLINNMDMHSLENLREDMNYVKVGKVLSDRELELTCEKFLENNLNISLTAKKLFIHRNTLLYRLNKIFRISGFDLRNFEDSINFKVAMLIHNYIENLF